MTKVVDLQTAYALVCEARGHPRNESIETLPSISGNPMELWFRRVLADTLYERKMLLDEDVVLASVYVAELLASRRGIEYRATVRRGKALANILADIVDARLGAFHLLMLGEQAFMMYCFCPDEVLHRPIEYRTYSRNMGVRAYDTFADVRSNEFGKRMVRAFVPVGDIVREKFMPPS